MVLDLDGSNAVTMRRVFGSGFDDLVAREDASGVVKWYGTDHLGSVRAIFDNSGGVSNAVDYDAFGGILSGVIVDRYSWTGREADALTGLRHNRARDYDPAIGRWTSEDPIGFAAGDVNLQRYVGNAFTIYTDPSGYRARNDVGILDAPVHSDTTGRSWYERLRDELSMIGSYFVSDPVEFVGEAAKGVAHGANDMFIQPVVRTGQFIWDVPNAAIDPYYQPYNPTFREFLNGERSQLSAWFWIALDAEGTFLTGTAAAQGIKSAAKNGPRIAQELIADEAGTLTPLGGGGRSAAAARQAATATPNPNSPRVYEVGTANQLSKNPIP